VDPQKLSGEVSSGTKGGGEKGKKLVISRDGPKWKPKDWKGFVHRGELNVLR